jgi:hypothetical protein
VPQRVRERCGCAERLTGPSRAQPASRALRCRVHCVLERGRAPRPFGPEPFPCDWTSAPAPVETARGTCGRCGLPRLRTWDSLAPACHAAIPLRRTGRGHGDVSRPQSTPSPALCTPPCPGDSASRRVWGSRMGAPADGNEDRTRCQRRTTLSLNPSGKNWQNPLLGGVCLWTTGVLISVRRRIDWMLGRPIAPSRRRLREV